MTIEHSDPLVVRRTKMIELKQINVMLKAQTNKAKYLRFGVICEYTASNIGLFYAIKAGLPYGWEIG